MKQLSFGDVVEAQRDPVAFRAKLALGLKGGPRQYGPMSLLRDAVLRMHRRKESPADARTALQAELADRFSGHRDRELTLERFDDYTKAYAARGAIVTLTRTNAFVPLGKKVSGDFRVGGQLPRIDMTAGGLEAWFLARKKGEWEADPRLPLARLAIAASLATPVSEVRVGVYCFADGEHHLVSSTDAELKSALGELTGLLLQLK
jgi:hypothetical protein